MLTAVLTDAETNEEVLVVFGGEGGATFAKTNKDDQGKYTEIYDNNERQIIAVKETPSEIKRKLSRIFS